MADLGKSAAMEIDSVWAEDWDVLLHLQSRHSDEHKTKQAQSEASPQGWKWIKADLEFCQEMACHSGGLVSA